MATKTEQEKATQHQQSTPQHEHHWLEKLVGDWTVHAKMDMSPGQTEEMSGTESVRSVEGLWFIGEGQAEMPGGGTGTSIMTLGYDRSKQKYVGTFLSSMSTYMWVYEGELDADERILTLDTVGPDMSGEAKNGELVRYRDIIEFKSDDHRVMRSRVQAKDGQWRQVMEMQYHRQ
jgi:hypothetical protein